MNNTLRPFHLAFPVSDIKETKKWYTQILGCSLGREAEGWVDFNFFGHQFVIHESPFEKEKKNKKYSRWSCCSYSSFWYTFRMARLGKPSEETRRSKNKLYNKTLHSI